MGAHEEAKCIFFAKDSMDQLKYSRQLVHEMQYVLYETSIG